jgi:predicted transcriptional regulator
MKFRMDTTLRFWVDCSYEDRKYKTANRTRAELIAEILHDYERSGDAMRYLNTKGQIAWKASPSMLSRLADAEREVQDDMEGLP